MEHHIAPQRATAAHGLAKLAGVVFGLAGLVAAAFAASEALQTSPLSLLSSRLIMREPFPQEVLDEFGQRAARYQAVGGCSVSAHAGSALLRAVSAERALATAADLDSRMDALGTSASALLKCAPTMGFGWFALYWVELNRFGPSQRALSYLDMSYRVTPHEAWVALMRNQVAIRLLPSLSPQTRAAVLDEWRDILKAGLFDHAARVLVHADPARRSELIAATASLDPATLKWLPVHLNRLGLEIELPGAAESSPPKRDRYRPFQ